MEIKITCARYVRLSESGAAVKVRGLDSGIIETLVNSLEQTCALVEQVKK